MIMIWLSTDPIQQAATQGLYFLEGLANCATNCKLWELVAVPVWIAKVLICRMFIASKFEQSNLKSTGLHIVRHKQPLLTIIFPLTRNMPFSTQLWSILNLLVFLRTVIAESRKILNGFCTAKNIKLGLINPVVVCGFVGTQARGKRRQWLQWGDTLNRTVILGSS